jgi:hypothetical protein
VPAKHSESAIGYQQQRIDIIVDIHDKSRFWLTGLIVLAVLNISLMGFIWYNHMARRDYPPPDDNMSDMGAADDFLARELELNQEQIKVYRGLHERQVFQSDSIRTEINRLGSEMVDELFSATPDFARIQQLSEAMGEEHAVFERKIFDHFIEIKQICNPDQQERLRQLITEIIKRSLFAPPPSGPARDDFRPGPPNEPPSESSRRNQPPPEGGPPSGR